MLIDSSILDCILINNFNEFEIISGHATEHIVDQRILASEQQQSHHRESTVWNVSQWDCVSNAKIQFKASELKP